MSTPSPAGNSYAKILLGPAPCAYCAQVGFHAVSGGGICPGVTIAPVVDIAGSIEAEWKRLVNQADEEARWSSWRS